MVEHGVEVGKVVGEPVGVGVARSLRPKPRQSGAMTCQSPARLSATNWNEAPTSIQPCSMKMMGAPGRPQCRTWVRRPRTAMNSEREDCMGHLK
jgi:hypothetical protein